MPVSLGSLHGKADRAVVEALHHLVGAVNRLEAELRAPVPVSTTDPGARALLRTLEQQIQSLRGSVDVLAAPPPPPPGVSGDPNTPPSDRLPLYDGLSIVQTVFALNPDLVLTECQTAAGGTWELMDAIVDALRAADPRFAYNGKRGNPNDPSLDAVAYDYGAVPGGEGATSVYVVDVIAGHCGPSPAPAWNDVTVFAPGVWISRGRF